MIPLKSVKIIESATSMLILSKLMIILGNYIKLHENILFTFTFGFWILNPQINDQLYPY